MSANKENEPNQMEMANEYDPDLIVMDVEMDSENELQFDERAGTPIELIDAATEASKDLLPSKSKYRYQKVYDNYIKWKETKKAISDSETVVVAYFNEMIKSEKKPTTIWATYSMLKSTLKIYNKVNIETYTKLSAILKKKSYGYEPKRATTFSEYEMQHFLDNAHIVTGVCIHILNCCRFV